MVQLKTVHIVLGMDGNLESGSFLVRVELQRDSDHFEMFDNSMGTYEDWYFDLSGGGVFGD